MTRRKPPRQTMTVTGGTFIGSAVGHGNTVRNKTISVGDLHQSASLRDLAAALTAVREELVQAAASPQAQAEIRHEISEIQQELTEAHPRGGVVRSRWGRVATVLGPVATASGAVAQITELITKLYSAS